MIDREKVIKGLECCRNGFCFACPYNDGVDGNVDCKQRWADDALELLKEQEPRVLTLDEIKEGEPYWLGAGKEFVTRPVICVHREDDAQKPYIMFVWEFGEFGWLSEDYGKTWRVWSAKPTDEERGKVAWDG